ncbi:MAG: response regulator, partial [Gaiellaceae bacterium]
MSLSSPQLGSEARPEPTHVLVVDDDDSVRAVLADVLQDEGFEVVGSARDGIEGVSLALSLEPDVVLLDIRMPRLDGIGAA